MWFSYIDDIEKIAGIFGALANEICLAVAVDIFHDELVYDSATSLASPSKEGRIVFGACDGLGNVMYAEKSFVRGIVKGTCPYQSKVTFTCLRSNRPFELVTITATPTICDSSEAPFDIRKYYFDAAAIRRIQAFAALDTDSKVRTEAQKLRTEMASWIDAAALEARENVMKCLENRNGANDDHFRNVTSTMASDNSTQNSLVNPAAMTPAARVCSTAATNASSYYTSVRSHVVPSWNDPLPPGAAASPYPFAPTVAPGATPASQYGYYSPYSTVGRKTN